MTSLLRALALLVAAALLPACPPPPDGEDAGSSAARAPHVEPGTTSPSSDGASAPTTPAAPRTTGAGDTAAARASSATEPVVYERLRGGVWVARCPACGEVQAEGATACPACRQPLSPWRQETLCTRCAGDGRCDHCGDDRVCLACDGDGACPSCTGGRISGKGCPDCGGSAKCGSCRGDGRRDAASGDFLPNEGWLHGACPTCVDASGLCPECGSSGKDAAGGACPTCAGAGACPDCGGDGACAWCAGDGACTVCVGGGHEVRNGAPRGPHERVRVLRTAAGSMVRGRVAAPPASQSLRLVRVDEGGKPADTTLTRAQLAPLSWILAVRDFPPGWDGRTAFEAPDLVRFKLQVADLAAEAGYWPLAARALEQAMTLDPGQAPAVRVRLQDLEAKRVEDWAKRVDDALKTGDRDRAAQLLEMVVFKGRGTAQATRAEVRLLNVRKDREAETAKLSDTERVRRATDARAAVERASFRARRRLDRARVLLERAAAAAPDDPSADRTFARAEHAATLARRAVQTVAFRDPPSTTTWAVAPEALVTESRLASANVLEAWTARAAAGGRFDLAARLARRGLALDAAHETLRNLLAQAEMGLARGGVVHGSPPPAKR